MDAIKFASLIQQLRLTGAQDQRVEVKSNVGKSILETLSAFSNGEGGYILVGLDEQAGFLPIKGFDAKKARDQVASRCEHLTPVVRPEISIHNVDDGKVLAVWVPAMPASSKPCYVTTQNMYNGSYIRTGDGDRKLTAYEVDRLQENRGQPAWDAELVSEAGVKDLNKEGLSDLLTEYKKGRPRTFADGEGQALKRLNIAKEGHPTLAALLALGEYPQEFFPRLVITFAVFPGTTKGDITTGLRLLDSETIRGPIPEMVERAIALVNRNMRTAALIGDVYRQDLPDYPLVAVREAVVNALMHRDYSPQSRGAQVQVNMFVDRLEITSPGGLYGNVSVDSLGKESVSSTRNQVLADLLSNISLDSEGVVAESRGTGFFVMAKALEEALMPPVEVRATLLDFTVIFRRRKVAKQERYLTAYEQVDALLQQSETMSSRELMTATGLSRTSVLNAIKELMKEGKVEATEPGRSPKKRYRSINKLTK